MKMYSSHMVFATLLLFTFVSFCTAIQERLLGKGKASVTAMQAFLMARNPAIKASHAAFMATCYRKECHREGINHDVAFVQMCLETNALRFNGQVKPYQHNFAGIGATDDGAAGCSFPTIRLGVRAHVQHLLAYASKRYPTLKVVDPRFHLVAQHGWQGSVRTVDDLASKWASDKEYGNKLTKLLTELAQHYHA